MRTTDFRGHEHEVIQPGVPDSEPHRHSDDAYQLPVDIFDGETLIGLLWPSNLPNDRFPEPDPAEEAAYIPSLERTGYRPCPALPACGAGTSRGAWPPDINLHVLPPGSTETERTLRFRDRLRASEADRELYERTKRQLAARQWTHLRHYTDAKAEVIETILARCPQNTP